MSDVSYWKRANDTVVKGTVITGGTSAFVTGIHQIFKKEPHYGRLSAVAALNGGITAVAFFSLREYIISPALIAIVPTTDYARQRQLYGWKSLQSDGHLPERSWSEIRTSGLADSWISGMLTGGSLRGLIAGRAAIIPGALTTGLITALLQLGYNEMQVMRITYVTRRQNEVYKPPEPLISPRVLGWFGLTQYTDEEYLKSLKKQKEGYLIKIRELEAEIEAERKK